VLKRAVCRIQVVDAIKVILDTANKKRLQPEESYRLAANYRFKRRKKVVIPARSNDKEVRTSHEL
jgi:hypothetical protein